jgi:hypothetical protein
MSQLQNNVSKHSKKLEDALTRGIPSKLFRLPAIESAGPHGRSAPISKSATYTIATHLLLAKLKCGVSWSSGLHGSLEMKLNVSVNNNFKAFTLVDTY